MKQLIVDFCYAYVWLFERRGRRALKAKPVSPLVAVNVPAAVQPGYGVSVNLDKQRPSYKCSIAPLVKGTCQTARCRIVAARPGAWR